MIRSANRRAGGTSSPATLKVPGRSIRSRAVYGARRAIPWGWGVILANSWLSLIVAVSAATAAGLLITIVLPGYTSPMSRLSTSKFGFPSLYRRIHKPFPVAACRLRRRVLSYTALGEGLMRSEPVLVPIIPMGKIERLLVSEGDLVRKGQLLAEIDDVKARIKADAARAALETARAELERVKIGSAYVLAQERPERDEIRLKGAEKESELRRQLIEMNQSLAQRGFASRSDILNQRIALVDLEARINEARFNLRMSSKGVSQSLVIAESAVNEAKLALEHRLVELADYKVFAIADGLVERCLVHQGEYNQDPGKPGFLIACDSWFEANFDQGTFGRVRVDQAAILRLEAFPSRFFPGRVEKINAFVNYDLGGPESTRPIRPMGTGAPEWPATFAVKIRLRPEEKCVVPGMTGFCVIRSEAEAACLPREAVSAVTSGKGIVHVIRGDGFDPREVSLGLVDGDWIQIVDGLKDDESVIQDGYQILEPTDRILVRPAPEGGK